jgi:hypothetical protein
LDRALSKCHYIRETVNIIRLIASLAETIQQYLELLVLSGLPILKMTLHSLMIRSSMSEAETLLISSKIAGSAKHSVVSTADTGPATCFLLSQCRPMIQEYFS